MNIILINHYAGSPKMGMEYRPYYMAREWVNAGHKVFILAADNAHVRTQKVSSKENFTEELIDGIKYIWVKTPEYQGNGLKRIINIFKFTSQIKRKAKYLSEKYQPDIIIASSTYPMDNYAAKKIADISGAKHIYEVHDLWPLSPMELGGHKASHPYIKHIQKAEDFAYKHANVIVSMLPETKSYMISRGMAASKWQYIPNGIYIEEWNNGEAIPIDIKNKILEIKASFNTLITYTGSHGIANALNSFIEAANFLKDKSVAFVLLGKGPEKNNLIRKSASLSNVFFFDSLDKKQIPTFLSFFDITYIGLKKQSLFRFGVSPNKLFDYMMAAKPIIQAINAGNDPVTEAKCGISIEAENPKMLAETIIKLRKYKQEDLRIMGENAQKYVLEKHDYKILASDFLKIFEKIIQK